MRVRSMLPAIISLIGLLALALSATLAPAANDIGTIGSGSLAGPFGGNAVRAQVPLTSTFTPTPLATATPEPHGVTITGTVRLGGPGGAGPGPGLPGVRLHRAVGAYPDLDAPSVLTGDQGRYDFGFLPLEPRSNQTVFVRPELPGYVFLPEWRWHEYGGQGSERAVLDFEARAVEGDPRALFALGFAERDLRFVIELRDPERIAAARAELAKPIDERLSVMGQIVKQPADYNPGWSYHLDPGTIELFDFAIEVCDGNPTYIEEHLDEVCGALLPRCTWCPWSSRIMAEITGPGASDGLFLPALLADATLGRFPVRVIEGPIEPDAWPGDPLEIVRAEVAADELRLSVRYSGGCEVHGFELVASSLFMESDPVQADLLLAHDDRDDPCDAIVGAELTFDLEPLKTAYHETYRGAAGPILLRLRGHDARLRYEFPARP